LLQEPEKTTRNNIINRIRKIFRNTMPQRFHSVAKALERRRQDLEKHKEELSETLCLCALVAKSTRYTTYIMPIIAYPHY